MGAISGQLVNHGIEVGFVSEHGGEPRKTICTLARAQRAAEPNQWLRQVQKAGALVLFHVPDMFHV